MVACEKCRDMIARNGIPTKRIEHQIEMTVRTDYNAVKQ